MNLEDVSDDEWAALTEADFSKRQSLEGLPLAEKWILSSLHQVHLIAYFAFKTVLSAVEVARSIQTKACEELLISVTSFTAGAVNALSADTTFGE